MDELKTIFICEFVNEIWTNLGTLIRMSLPQRRVICTTLLFFEPVGLQEQHVFAEWGLSSTHIHHQALTSWGSLRFCFSSNSAVSLETGRLTDAAKREDGISFGTHTILDPGKRHSLYSPWYSNLHRRPSVIDIHLLWWWMFCWASS